MHEMFIWCWCWDEVRIVCIRFLFLVCIWASEKTTAVSLKSSFGTKEECFPLFHSVHHTHVALLVWAEGEVKLTSLPFLLSAYKKMNTTTLRLARVFTHSPPKARHFSGHISGRSVENVLDCLWKEEKSLFGSCWLDQQRLNTEETWKLWLDCCWCCSESLMVSYWT